MPKEKNKTPQMFYTDLIWGHVNYRGLYSVMDLVLIPGVCSLKSCKHLHKQLHGGSSVSQIQAKTLQLCNIMVIEWYKEEDTRVYRGFSRNRQIESFYWTHYYPWVTGLEELGLHQNQTCQ